MGSDAPPAGPKAERPLGLATAHCACDGTVPLWCESHKRSVCLHPMRLLTHLQSAARRLRPALPGLVGVGMALLALVLSLVVFGDPQRSEALLLPAIVGLLWCLCAWVLITTFDAVPAPASAVPSRWGRFKRRIARAWYWLLALAFLAVTASALLLTYRLVAEALG